MTTLVDNTMTLSNARHSNDDQQVPDANSVVVPGQQKSPRPRLPDFGSLLLETQNNTVLNTPDLLQSLDFGYQDQLDTAAGSFMEAGDWGECNESIYDGFSLEKPIKQEMPTATSLALLEPVRPTTLSLAPSQALPLTTTNGTPIQYDVSPASTSSSMTPDMEQSSLESMEQELNSICRDLWIPRDPTTWSYEHVQKWLNLIRNRYNLPEGDHYLVGIDGTTLCMLSKEDLIQRTSQSVGPFIYADLEWWKAACGSPMECTPPVTYTDLTTSTNLTAPAVSSSNPNMYSTAPALSSPIMNQPEIPTPVLSDLELTKSTLYQINSEVQQQQPQHAYSYLSAMWDDSTMNGSANSCDSSLNSVDFCALNAQVKQEVMEDESDEDEEELTGEKRRYVSHSKHTIHLWQFLKNLLQSPERYGNYIKWQDQVKGIFKIENSREVAKLWGQRKNRPAMNYDKLSRSIRQYYKKGIIKKTTHSKRLVYQFQPSYL